MTARRRAAWVPLGTRQRLHGSCKGASYQGFLNVNLAVPNAWLQGQANLNTRGTSLGVTVWDLFYVGLTIVVFAVLFLILKGIESFER